MAAGYNGVTLFFVLSGFVLAWNYSDRLAPERINSRAVWSFAVARFARLYPLYLVALLWVTKGSFGSYGLQHLLAIQAWSPDVAVAYAFNGPGWSIGVELFLYACFPILLVALLRVRSSPRALILIAMLTAAALGALTWWFVTTGRADLPWADSASAHRWLYRMPLTRLGDFALGIIAALLVRTRRLPVWLAGVAQVIGVGSFLTLMMWDSLFLSAWSWDFAYALPSFLLILGLASNPQTYLAKVLGTRPLVLAGESSYAFYLFHVPLIAAFGIGLGVYTTWVGWTLATAAGFFMILFTATGAHHIIERPTQRWLRRILDPSPRPPSVRADSPQPDNQPELVSSTHSR